MEGRWHTVTLTDIKNINDSNESKEIHREENRRKELQKSQETRGIPNHRAQRNQTKQAENIKQCAKDEM